MIWASDCHVCNTEVGQYIKFHQSHRRHHATMLGISIDGAGNKKGALAFIKKHGVTFPNLIGDPGRVAELFLKLTGVDLTGTPAIMIYSPSGKLLAAQLGAVPTFLIDNFINQNQDKADK